MAEQLEFHLKEYEALRGEVADLEKASQRLMTFTVGGSAATFAWLATHGGKGPVLSLPLYVAYFVPAVVAWIAWQVFDAWGAHIFTIGEYLWKVEQRYGSEGLGWEHFLHPNGQYDVNADVTDPVGKAFVSWWRWLVVANLLIAICTDGALLLQSYQPSHTANGEIRSPAMQKKLGSVPSATQPRIANVQTK